MRTIKRNVNEVNTSLSSYTKLVKYHNQLEWKGIVENKNIFTTDQLSQADAKNVYVDDHGSLVSRPVLLREPLNKEILPANSELVDSITYGKIKIYVSNEYLNSENHYKVVVVADDTSATLSNLTKYHISTIENYIICFNNLGAKVFDINNQSAGWQDFSKFVEIPVFKRIINNNITEYSKNQFTNKYIEEYVYSNISKPILPKNKRANVTISADNVVNKWILDQVDILTDYRLFKEIYYKPEYSDNGYDTSRISAARNVICVTQNEKVLVSFNNGSTFTTYWYPEHGKLLGIASISDDGSSYFFVALDAVYRLNLKDGTWTSIYIHNDSTKKLGEQNTYYYSRKGLYHFLNADTFVFALWANGANTNIAGRGCEFPVLWFMGPWLAGYDAIPYEDNQDFTSNDVPKFKSHIKIDEKYRGTLGCSVALARQFFTEDYDPSQSSNFYWGNVYESIPKQSSFGSTSGTDYLKTKTCLKIFIEDGYISENMTFSSEPSSTNMPSTGTSRLQKFATIMCAGYRFVYHGSNEDTIKVAADDQLFILPGYFCGDYVYNDEHFTEALDIKPFWNNRIRSKPTLTGLPPLAGRIGFNIISERPEDYTYSPKLVSLSSASYRVTTSYTIYGIIIDSISQNSNNEDGSTYQVKGKMFFTYNGNYRPTGSYPADGWRDFTWEIGRQTGNTAADTLLNVITISSSKYLKVDYTGYENKTYSVSFDFFNCPSRITDTVGIIGNSGALYYKSSSNVLSAQYFGTDNQADDVNNPIDFHNINSLYSNIIISDNTIIIHNKTPFNNARVFITAFNTEDQALIDITVGEDSTYTDIPNVSYSDTELFLGFDNKLSITANTRDSNGNILFNLPPVNDQKFIENITNIINISTTDIALFFEDNITICSKVQDSNISTGYRYDYHPTKLSTGTRLGDSVINTIEGTYTIFPTKRGLAFMNYQAFMATTDQVLTYITDNIESRYDKFYAESDMIKIVQRRDKLYITNGTNGIYIYDLARGAWWYWELPNLQNNARFEIKKLTTDQIDLFVVGRRLFKFGDQIREYKDFEALNSDDWGEDSYSTPLPQKIEWFIMSQPLHMQAPNYYKNLKQLVFQLLDDNQDNKQHTILVQIQCYRKKLDTKVPELIAFKIDELRTFVKRFNYWKINEIQYAFGSDNETAIPTKLRLNGVSIKYELGEEVR